jgi:thymidylate synthase
MTSYRNIETAFLGELRHIVEVGMEIEVRGNLTREVRARAIEIDSIRERYLVVPGRNNNVFASIAESMWVLAGRDDIKYLAAYLPRAIYYSDDGLIWRAAYGPRLRNWNGKDQLAEVLAILRRDLSSRRAVATLYDPDRDFVQSKDIPCNNWLHFLVRDGRVDLHIASRSTDIWWGFSGINAFEWSLLLEMMAFWLGQKPGRLVFFTSSLHLYERHFERARRLLSQYAAGPTTANLSLSPAPHFTTTWERFPIELSEWMRLEASMRAGITLDQLEGSLTDPLLISYAQMMDVFWRFKRRENQGKPEQVLAPLGNTQLRQAADEFLHRPRGQNY